MKLISSNFLMWKFYWNAQFPYGFGWIVRNSVETVHFHIISTPENLVKFRYFLNLNRKGKITNGRQCVVESTKQERTWELWRSCSISEGFLIRRAILTLIRRVYPSYDSPETMRKLCLSAKFPHQEIRWNYGILRSVTAKFLLQN